MAKGFVSMRNEDGTQWAVLVEGILCWTEDRSEATLIDEVVFRVLETNQESTRERDCPDNGFFGVYNLKFTPKKKQ